MHPIEDTLKKKGVKVKMIVVTAVPYMDILDIEKKREGLRHRNGLPR